MLVIQENVRKRLQDCFELALEKGTLENLLDILVYLGQYGHRNRSWTAEPPVTTRCTLGYDFYQHSFGITMEQLEPLGGSDGPADGSLTYRHMWQGGLIFDDKTNTWSVHT